MVLNGEYPLNRHLTKVANRDIVHRTINRRLIFVFFPVKLWESQILYPLDHLLFALRKWFILSQLSALKILCLLRNTKFVALNSWLRSPENIYLFKHINISTRRHQIYMFRTNHPTCVRAGLLLERSEISTWFYLGGHFPRSNP